MNEAEIVMIENLRALGYAVVIIYPEVLGNRDPSHVEDILWDRFDNIPGEDYEE